MFKSFSIILLALSILSASAAELTRDTAAAAMKKAGAFFRAKVAAHGGYLWRYSEDLALREGENKADADTIWVQPPGTPAVGLAFLNAFRATNERFYLDAAIDAGKALVQGQLRSGGWTYPIYFAPDKRKSAAYRVDKERERAFNVSTFDDDTTQAALRFLMQLDQALDFKDAAIHEAVAFALESVLKAQFANGAWSQGFEGPAEERPVLSVAVPDDWRQMTREKKYWFYYTLNDNTMRNTIDTLLEAAAIYSEPKYKASAERAGDFLIRAQLPEPQRAWAQQYDLLMRPAWARKFEPPAVSGGESQGVIRALMQLYRHTADAKYLAPIPSALDYLRRSLLPDGRLARFYELKTNKPLYFTKEYEVTYSDANMPTHYGFKIKSQLDDLSADYEKLKATPPEKLKPAAPAKPKPGDSVTRAAEAAVNALDDHGRWIEEGKLKGSDTPRKIIQCETFIKHIESLARYLAAQ